MTVRVGLDALGGDHAPGAVVSGALMALREHPAMEIALVGVPEQVEPVLASTTGSTPCDRLRFVPCTQHIGMAESALDAIRAKPDSSLVQLIELAARGEVDAVVSAGNTGAFAAAAQLRLRTLPGVSRPGIAVTIPAFHGPVVLCDVGANIHARPQHLYEYARMAGPFAAQVHGIRNPRIGVLSVGEEEGKGTDLVRRTWELLRADKSLNFVGNIEGRDLFADRSDVVVCDGFVGNVALKLLEGMAEGLLRTIEEELRLAGGNPDLLAAVERVRRRHDYSEYGGAPLLGINGVCIIAHGRSDARAIRNAVRVAARFVEQGLNAMFAAGATACSPPVS